MTMTDKQKEDWRSLCEYVEQYILLYDVNQHMQKDAALRLKGIANGKVFANNNIPDNGNYGFDVILNTFKANRSKIMTAIQNKEFDSEGAKMAYIAAIIRNNINDMYERMQRVKKAQEDGQKIDTTIIRHKKTAYQQKTDTKNDEKYGGMW